MTAPVPGDGGDFRVRKEPEMMQRWAARVLLPLAVG